MEYKIRKIRKWGRDYRIRKVRKDAKLTVVMTRARAYNDPHIIGYGDMKRKGFFGKWVCDPKHNDEPLYSRSQGSCVPLISSWGGNRREYARVFPCYLAAHRYLTVIERMVREHLRSKGMGVWARDDDDMGFFIEAL